MAVEPDPHVDPALLPPMIEPATTALVIIDVQTDFLSPAGVAGRWGIDLGRFERPLRHIDALIAAGRARGVTQVFVRVVTRAETDSTALRLLHARNGRPLQSLALCRAGTPGAAYYRVAPRPGDLEIEKPLYSSFVGTDLDAQLRARGIDTLVLVGFTTDCCVDCTARDAFHRNYNVFMVSDATEAYEPELHTGALNALSKNCALLTDTAAVLGAWSGAESTSPRSSITLSAVPRTPTEDPRLQKWLVFAAVSLAFFFLNLSTFTSLGVVLYSMVAELHWSLTAAGFSFSLLGLACGLSSLLPAWTLRRFGGRATLCLGAGLLIAGFWVASLSRRTSEFYAAMVLVGVGYSLAGNMPGVSLIAAWFTRGASRSIGLYYMIGALGAAFGPPIVEAIVTDSGGWRSHWRLMAIASAVVGATCYALVRDPLASAPPAAQPEAKAAAPAWSARAAILTPQFMLVAATMALTMACVSTYSSVTVPHLVKLGATPAAAALVLGAMAITATLIKGGAGRLCELVPTTAVLAGGLVLQACGSLLLGTPHGPPQQYAGALVFGAGWGLCYVAGTVILLDHFGPRTGSRILSVVWLITTVAAVGPLAAGMIADRFGSFLPMFQIYAGLLVLLALPVAVMRAPVVRQDAGAIGSYSAR
jgi:nicotinamidase-related amidase/MFS family permease